MGARTLPSTTRRNAGSGCSRSGGSGEGPNSDALLTSKSNRPARRAAAAIARRSLGRATSPGTPVTMAPAALRRSVAAPNAFSWRAVRMRVHRCRARNSARVYPRPRLAPVIRATCSTEARFGDAARSAIEELSMADTGLPRFISLLVYKLYKPSGSRRMQLNGLRGQLHAASDVLPNDACQRWRDSRPTRRTSPKGASIPHALRPCGVSRLAGARPRAPRPDVADDLARAAVARPRPRRCVRGGAGQAVTSPGETPPRRGVLGPTRGWHLAAGMLEAKPTASGGVPSRAYSRPAPRRHHGRDGTGAQGTPRFAAQGTVRPAGRADRKLIRAGRFRWSDETHRWPRR